MSKNICVLTGARNSGMCKIYGYLRENGVNLTTPRGKPAGVPMIAFYQHPYTARALG